MMISDKWAGSEVFLAVDQQLVPHAQRFDQLGDGPLGIRAELQNVQIAGRLE